MHPYLAEFIGTCILILLGNGVVANCVLKDTKSGGPSWIVIATGWGFAVYIAAVVAGPYSGAHLNPALTIGIAVAGEFPWHLVPGYIIAQLLGATFGAFLVWLFYQDHFKITEDSATKRACFCTEPAIRNYKVNIISEIIGTFLLVFVILYISGGTLEDNTGRIAKIGFGSLGALPAAILVWSIGLSLGGTTGYAINPARDLGPRIMLSQLKFLHTKADWRYSPIPILGPIVGAALAALVYHVIMS